MMRKTPVAKQVYKPKSRTTGRRGFKPKGLQAENYILEAFKTLHFHQYNIIFKSLEKFSLQ